MKNTRFTLMMLALICILAVKKYVDSSNDTQTEQATVTAQK